MQLNFLDYIHTEDRGSKFLQQAGNYVAEPQSIRKVFFLNECSSNQRCVIALFLPTATLLFKYSCSKSEQVAVQLYKRFFPCLFLSLRCQSSMYRFLNFIVTGKHVASYSLSE